MEKTVKLKIITVHGIFFEDDIVSINLRTKTGGEITLLPNHASFVSNIDVCKMKVVLPANIKKLFYIGVGLLYVENNIIRIITDDILGADNIDIERARKEQELLLAELSKIQNVKERAVFKYRLRKVINRIEVYNNKNK